MTQQDRPPTEPRTIREALASWFYELLIHVCGHTLGHLTALVVLAWISLLPATYLPSRTGATDLSDTTSINEGIWI